MGRFLENELSYFVYCLYFLIIIGHSLSNNAISVVYHCTVLC